jgi:RHS repeat-associated protein
VAVDATAERTVVTNLRLPGQYDERLFAAAGLTGLQGPYYNWNRWYLPGAGRYLKLDPLALGGGFNGRFGPDWYSYASATPLRETDPMGLATYRCKTPLHAVEDKFGKNWAKRAKDWGAHLYHQYSCIVWPDGTVRCGGQDREGSAWRSPGKKSGDDYDGGSCKESRPDDKCYEDCLQNEWDKPRPMYGIPFGTDCQEYDDNVNDTCRKKCGGK